MPRLCRTCPQLTLRRSARRDQLNDNAIESFDALLFPASPALTTVYLERNPLSSEFDYRKRLAATLPSLTQIDATPCRPQGYVHFYGAKAAEEAMRAHASGGIAAAVGVVGMEEGSAAAGRRGVLRTGSGRGGEKKTE